MYDTPRRQTTRFGTISEIPSTEGAVASDDKENSPDAIYTSVGKQADGAVARYSKHEQSKDDAKKSDNIEMDDMKKDNESAGVGHALL